MANDTLEVKRGNLVPAPTTQLKYDDGTVANVTGATVLFVMRSTSGTAPKVSAQATIVGLGTNGTVIYPWVHADTDTTGEFRGEWFVTFADGTPQTFPTVGFLEIRIVDDLTLTPSAPAFCTPSDLLLGDMELGSTLVVQDYIVRAARDIQITLAQKYVVPIVTTNQLALDVLRVINADLASSYIIHAQAQGGEDNRVNAYGTQLWNRANGKLMFYMDTQNLPGVPLLATASAFTAAPIGITNEDSTSGVASFYEYVQNPLLLPPTWPQRIYRG